MMKKNKKTKKKTGASMGVKDADTMDMPVVDREKDAMNEGASMDMKNDGASFFLGGGLALAISKRRNSGAGGKARKDRKAANRSRRQKYGFGKKGRARMQADIQEKNATARLEKLGADDGTMGTKGSSPTISSVGNAAAGEVGNLGVSMSKYDNAQGSSMSGQSYDAKQAYNKNLSASARLHYLENNRADKKAKGTQHRSPIMRHMKGYK